MAESERLRYRLTNTLEALQSQYGSRSNVTGEEIIEWLSRRHSEYGGQRYPDLRPPDPLKQSATGPIDWWFAETRRLFDATAIDELNGRILVLGIAMIDQDVGRQLWASGLVSAVANEVVDFYFPAPTPAAAPASASATR